MVVDVFLRTVDNNDSILKARYCESDTGAIEHGEYIIVILSIPRRTYKFFNIIGLKHQSEEVCQNKNL